ncbi:MAG: TAXI family TRAP transporter solute-binding subunit [Motiliproteus sp.]
MSKELQQHHRKESFLFYGSGLALVLLGFVLAYQFVEPAPPTSISIATGNPKNAYYQFATEYKESLQQQGIDLNVISSEGSVENLQLLREGKVDMAFVQGGIPKPDGISLQSLGSLYFEPLWIFYQQDINFERLSGLSNQRLAIGKPGSGTRAVALQLLADNGINLGNAEFLSLSGNEAATALLNGDIDAFFSVTSAKSPVVKELLKAPGIKLFSFERAAAYTKLHRFLSSVTLPAGIADMEKNIPNHDVTLIAPAATLVVREDFHPALATLMLQAATKIHSEGGIFEDIGQFPSAKFTDYPIHEDAERFLKSGPPFLQRFMPFWMANLVDRLIVMLVPLLTLMIPLAKVLPPTYRWRVRSRIYRWYDQLRSLDFRAEGIDDIEQAKQLLNELIAIEKDVMQVVVPKSYADTQYNLRLHIRLIRERLERIIINYDA